MNILGVVLARKGSKGIKNKNYLKINDKTLVEIALRNALKSKKLSKLIFSTDDKGLQKKAIKMGVQSPFLRPSNLSNDKASSYSVLRHAANWLKKNENWKADIIVLLQPTTPFRTSKHIDDVINLLLKSKSDAAMTITDNDYPPHWMFYQKKKQLKCIIKNGNKFTRRQDTPKCFKPSGMVYAFKKNFLFKIKGVLPQNKTVGLYVKPEIAINIDNYDHYLLAKIKAEKKYK